MERPKNPRDAFDKLEPGELDDRPTKRVCPDLQNVFTGARSSNPPPVLFGKPWNPAASATPTSGSNSGTQSGATGTSIGPTLFRNTGRVGQLVASQPAAAQPTAATSANPDSTNIKEEGAVAIKQEKGSESTAGNVQPATKPDPVSGPIESFDPRGELILVVGPPGLKQVNFRVCARALARESPLWDQRLYGSNSKDITQENQQGASWVARLPGVSEVGANALRIIFQAVHYKSDEPPTALHRDLLFQLVDMCDKYGVLRLLKPSWDGWIAKLSRPTLDPTTFVIQMWVAYKLGHLRLYKDILFKFLLSAQTRPESGDGSLFLAGYPNYVLRNNPYLKELGLFGKWAWGLITTRDIVLTTDFGMGVRSVGTRSVEDDQRDCRQSQQSFGQSGKEQTTQCKSHSSSADWKVTCDCAMLGGLTRAAIEKPWYSSGVRGWEAQVAISVLELVGEVGGARTAAIGESRMGRKQADAHIGCTPWERFELGEILRVCPVDDIVAMAEPIFRAQASKSGLELVR